MLDWLDHPAGADRFGRFTEHVANRDYGAAERLLVELVDLHDVDPVAVAHCLDLLARAQRLAEDQRRLADVAGALADDEGRIRAELAARQPTVAPHTATPEAATTAPAAASAGPPADHDGLAIWLLGPCRLSHGGHQMQLANGDRAAAVLRYLAAQPVTGVHKEQLAAAFWPEADERSARRSLHQVIYNIRRRLLEAGADAELRFVSNRYVLGDHTRWRDIDELQAAMEAARSARDRGDVDTMIAASERVDSLYQGDFLAEHPYDDWAEAPRRHHRQLHREAVGVLLDHHGGHGAFCRVVHLAERLLQLDPTDEDVVRRLMQAHVELGHPQLAAATFSTQAHVLAEDYGLPPSSETMALARTLIPHLLDE